VYDSGPDVKAAEHMFNDRTGIYGATVLLLFSAKASIAADDPRPTPTTRGKNHLQLAGHGFRIYISINPSPCNKTIWPNGPDRSQSLKY
jgi:hypothetical protein